MRDYRDLALEDGALAYTLLEDSYVRALAQAATYRQMALVAFDDLQETHQALERTQQRLRQTMGLAPWHTEETE